MMQAGRRHDVFISYQWRDRARVEPIARWLSREAGLSVFFDYWYLVPGQPWPQALEKAVGSCSAVAVCIGSGELGSWQQREMNLALERQAREPGFPVIPVLLPGADPVLGFLSQNTWIDLREAPHEPKLLAALASAVQGEPPGRDISDRVCATRASVCPYRGLLHFREEDAAFFFGRELAIEQLVTAVDRHSFTAVVGPSGSGKSSVVRAGLVPRLRNSRDPVWEVATLVPGDRPLRAIAAAFVPLLQPDASEVDLLLQIDALARALAEDHATVRDVVQRLLVKQEGTQRLLLIVDQWEELYTLAHPDARKRFIELLLDASSHAPVSVVLTLRGDFVSDALGFRPLADRMQGAQVNVGPMMREELTRAIQAPASYVGLEFEPGLVARILDDIGDAPGHLPLLEFVLKRLWDLKAGRVMLHDAYDHIGRVEGAIASKAENVFAALSALEQEAVRRVFLRLARPAEGREYTRRRATAAELPVLSSAVVRKLADERLVVTGTNAGTTEATVEVSHEALIQHWNRLRGWLDRDREFLLWRQRLHPLVEEWRRSGDEAALRGSLLSEAERWGNERPDELALDERGYIRHSADLRVREEDQRRLRHERELAQARDLVRLLLLLSVTVIALGSVFAWALYQTTEAQAAAERAQLTLAADRFREATVRAQGGNSREALALFASALRLDPDSVAIRAASLDALLAMPLSRVSLQHADVVSSAVFSSDGTHVVTASADTTAYVWNAESGQAVGDALQHAGAVTSAAFSADGTRVVTASADTTARVWNAHSGQAVGAPLRHESSVYRAAFSPDGTRVATASADTTARVWDARTGEAVGPPLQHAGLVYSATFSTDGTRVVTASGDATARVWDARTGDAVSEGLRHAGPVYTSAFSPDGSRVVTASEDGTAQVWDARTARPVGGRLRHAGAVYSAAFSADGTRVVTASADMTAQVWDARTGQAAGQALHHAGRVYAAAFSSDGTRVVTASADTTARVWNARTGQSVGPPLQHAGHVMSARFNTDGTRVVTASADTTARVWDPRTGRAVGTTLAHAGSVWFAGFSRDGMRVITASADTTARVWDARTGGAVGTALPHADAVWSPAFDADGTRVVTVAADTAFVWDVQTGQAVGAPLRHAGAIYSAAFSADGARVVSASADTTALVWDARSGQPLGAPLKHTSSVYRAAFSVDGTRVVTASADKTGQLWDARTGRAMGARLQHAGAVISAAFSSDGQRVVTASVDTTARVWDAWTGQAVGAPLPHADAVWSVAFSADGTRVVTASGNTARVWDARTGQTIGAPLQHSGPVYSAVFSADGMRVVTASADKTARVWDARTGQTIGAPLQHADAVRSAVFSMDGTRVVTASEDKTARVWDVPIGLPSEATLLAEAAEALSGYAVTDARSLVRLPDAPGRLASLAKRVAGAPSGQPTAISVLHWGFEDPWARTISPLSGTTVESYIIERLKRCSSEAQREAEFQFLGHELFGKAAEFCSSVATGDPNPVRR
jgi:WD40 repeat protein